MNCRKTQVDLMRQMTQKGCPLELLVEEKYLNVRAINMFPHFIQGDNILVNMSIKFQYFVFCMRTNIYAMATGRQVTIDAVIVQPILRGFMNCTRPKKSSLQKTIQPLRFPRMLDCRYILQRQFLVKQKCRISTKLKSRGEIEILGTVVHKLELYKD